MTPPTAVFDGHNDALLRLYMKAGADPDSAFIKGGRGGHLDLPRARSGGLSAGLFAIFVPSPNTDLDSDAVMRQPRYDIPEPGIPGRQTALSATLSMAAILFRIERESHGLVSVCRSGDDIRATRAAGGLAAVLHLEGAEAIDPNFYNLEILFQAGLRSLGPVWSRANIFGHGVPFRFPSTPDTGPGLTDRGRDLVRACNRLGILVDLSHLNEKGFWDVAGLSDAPLVATHSNAHALCPHARNLTDRQLDAIGESRGLVGVNFATAFLRPDGRMNADTPLDQIVRHVDYLVDKLGIDGVGLGSDFDGAIIPGELGDSGGLPRLVEALNRHGYSADEIGKICYENWLAVLDRTWRDPGSS